MRVCVCVALAKHSHYWPVCCLSLTTGSGARSVLQPLYLAPYKQQSRPHPCSRPALSVRYTHINTQCRHTHTQHSAVQSRTYAIDTHSGGHSCGVKDCLYAEFRKTLNVCNLDLFAAWMVKSYFRSRKMKEASRGVSCGLWRDWGETGRLS